MGGKGKKNVEKDTPEAPKQSNVSNTEPTDQTRKSLTFPGKIMVFFVFPVFVGMLGLLANYLDKSDPDRKLRIERDFALPFSITLLLTIVVGFQTSGFATKPQPLVRWPKVRKHQKVRHVYCVKGQDPSDSDGKEIEDKKND